jgi:AcrR family transcriptional regulator
MVESIEVTSLPFANACTERYNNPVSPDCQIAGALSPYPDGVSSPESGVEPAGSGREKLLQATIGYFAENGIGDASLRQVAAAIGSSHRMLIYHFGSRDGLLAAVVEELERSERDILADLLAQEGRPGRERAWAFWTHVADVVDFYGPLYFELASRAMRSTDPQGALRIPNVEMWVEALSDMWESAGLGKSQARIHARLNLAVSRGLLHDLLLTRDRRSVDAAMAMWDWLSFDDPSPVRTNAELSKGWHTAHDPK